MATTDEQLLADFQASRSPAAFEELVARHLPVVRNLAYRLVSCGAAADDIAQDVFLKVWRHADSFQGAAKFSTWLYRIAVNTANEHLRRQSVTQSVSECDGQLASPAHERPEQYAMDGELSMKIELALAQLSAKLRTAVVLTSIEHFSAKEAAKIERCSTATMHWRVHQARKELRRLLQEYLKP